MYKFLEATDREVFIRIGEYFKNKIEILYGNQDSALQKIHQGTDRKCLLLRYRDEDIGLLVYKTKLNEEHKIKKAFEIKTLFVINPEKYSGRKIATRLLLKACQEALKRRAKHIFVTACSERPEVLGFFLKRGFQVKKCLTDYHKNGSVEFLLVNNSPILLFFTLIAKLLISHRSELLSSTPSSTFPVVQNKSIIK